MKTRVVVFGTSPFGLAAFSALQESSAYEIVAVVSQPAKPVGRQQRLTLGAIGTWAEAQGLPLYTPSTLRTPEALSQLRDLSADIFLVAAYGLILPAAVLAIPHLGCLNIHASLLPKYRGASPISAAILQGDASTGITYMVMDEGCDTGPMLRTHTIPVAARDTRVTLESRLSRVAGETILPLLNDWVSQNVKPQPQPTNDVSLAPKIKRQDGLARWESAVQVERAIRALVPWPGVWTTWQGREMKILAATVELGSSSGELGSIQQHGVDWAIRCGDGWLIPTEIQFSGKQPQPAKNIPGSYPGFINSVLG